MISISVILCIWYWKVEFCTKSSCTNSFSYVHVSILHNQRSCSNALTALLLLYPSVVLVLANRTGCRQAQQSWMLCQSAYLLPFLHRTPFQQDLDFSGSASVGCRKASVCSGWRGMGRQAQSQVRCKTWLFFQRRDYHSFFFPFKILVKGVLVENGKTELCSWAYDQVWLQTEKINVLSVVQGPLSKSQKRWKHFPIRGIHKTQERKASQAVFSKWERTYGCRSLILITHIWNIWPSSQSFLRRSSCIGFPFLAGVQVVPPPLQRGPNEHSRLLSRGKEMH